MTDEDFDIYYAIMLDGALKEGFLRWASDYVVEMAQAPPESPKMETPLDLGVIVMTTGAKEYLGDDDVISALRRLRWGDYGYVRPEVVVSNDEIVAIGMIEPLLGVYVMESGACVRVETYIGRYTTVLLPREARWWPIKEDDAQSSNATETLMNGEKTTAEEELTARCNDCGKTWPEDFSETCENCGSDHISTIVDDDAD